MSADAPPALTPAQRAALGRAVENGGTLESGGLDGDRVRFDVLARLRDAGLLRWRAGALNDTNVWEITEAGREALKPRPRTGPRPPRIPAGPRTPVPVHCRSCQHEWAVGYLPMEAGAFSRLLRHARCPNCSATSRFMFMGPRAPAPDAAKRSRAASAT